MSKDFEVSVKLRNNRIKGLRVAAGFTSPCAFAKAKGIQTTTYCQMEALTFEPRAAKGGWKQSAVRVAALFNLLPEDLWPPAVLAVAKTEAVFEADAEELLRLTERTFASLREPPQLAEDAIAAEERSQALEKALARLRPMDRAILTGIYGEDDDKKTLREIGERYGVSQERIRQIQLRILAKIRYKDGDLLALVSGR